GAVGVVEGRLGGDVRGESQVNMKNRDAFAAGDGTDDEASQAKFASGIESRSTRSSSAQRAPAEDATPGERANGDAPDLQHVLNAAAVLGITSERYMAYAAKAWGPGWKINALGRRR